MTDFVKAISYGMAMVLVANVAVSTAQEPVPLRSGMVIDKSIAIRPGVYRLSSPDLVTPVITVRGSGITLDLAGVELVGATDGVTPDRFAGLAILVDGGERITIRQARIRGYKVGILARGVSDLHLSGNDVSANWKQRLSSKVEKESLVDWMSYHNNDKDEWLCYGAGLYLSDIDGGRIERNVARHGQNGLMVTRSKNLTIWNNDFSFLSSLGIGFYRTTDSRIMHNRIDWCVRGYSHGFYNRGQDSAGILMYEQSSRNVVAYNSVTHGGDGLFLWAGQSTMESGQGGSNDNLFFGNDFSHAPTNGIEATFSRNVFVNNRVEENWHGVWGGYSFDSVIVGNTFSRNQEAIAIEHGQDNVIANNTFTNDDIGIRLWANERQDPNWGYPKNRDTRSRDYSIFGNTMNGVTTPMQITRTENVKVDASQALQAPQAPQAPEKIPDGIDAMIPAGARRGREFIIVDEWGPYDWQAPKLWPVARSDESPLRLRVLGPAGKWTLASVRGGAASARGGAIPGEVTITPSAGRVTDFDITLRDSSGRAFGYSRFFIPIEWSVRFFDASQRPYEPPDIVMVSKQEPIKTQAVDRLDYLSSRGIADGLPIDNVALVAEAVVELPPGEFILRTISDDGVRAYVDDKLMIDRWDVHESVVDETSIRGGRRKLRVEYFERTGWAELRVEIVKHRTLP